MSNKFRGEVDVEINGKSCILFYGQEALARLQLELGKANSFELLDELSKCQSFTYPHFAEVLWAGLITRQPDMTLDEVKRGNYGAIAAMLAMIEALSAAFGYSKVEVKEDSPLQSKPRRKQ